MKAMDKDDNEGTFKVEDIDKVLTKGDIFTFTIYNNYQKTIFHGVYLYVRSMGPYRIEGYRLLVVQEGFRNRFFEMKRDGNVVFPSGGNSGYATTMRKI